MTTELPAFGTVETCRKCGAHRRGGDPGEEWGYTFMPGTETIRAKCWRCGYYWSELPVDRQGEADGA